MTIADSYAFDLISGVAISIASFIALRWLAADKYGDSVKVALSFSMLELPEVKSF